VCVCVASVDVCERICVRICVKLCHTCMHTYTCACVCVCMCVTLCTNTFIDSRWVAASCGAVRVWRCVGCPRARAHNDEASSGTGSCSCGQRAAILPLSSFRRPQHLQAQGSKGEPFWNLREPLLNFSSKKRGPNLKESWIA